MFSQDPKGFGEGKQGLVAEGLPVVLHHNHAASWLRRQQKVSGSSRRHERQVPARRLPPPPGATLTWFGPSLFADCTEAPPDTKNTFPCYCPH